MISSQTELRRIEVDLNQFQSEQVQLEREKRDLDAKNRQVEKNFYAESKRQDELEVILKSLKVQIDQLELRKEDLL